MLTYTKKCNILKEIKVGISLAFSSDSYLDNDTILTSGFTIGINTAFLVMVVFWVYNLIATGDTTLIPGMI